MIGSYGRQKWMSVISSVDLKELGGDWRAAVRPLLLCFMREQLSARRNTAQIPAN